MCQYYAVPLRRSESADWNTIGSPRLRSLPSRIVLSVIKPILVGRLKEGHDVLWRDTGLDVVHVIEHEPTTRLENLDLMQMKPIKSLPSLSR